VHCVSHHHRHHCGPSHVSSFLCIAVIVSHSHNGFPQSHRHSRSLPSAIGTKEKGECIERKESRPRLYGWRRQDENARKEKIWWWLLGLAHSGIRNNQIDSNECKLLSINRCNV
jgi:hypothetical protein